jgi:hypothetical protein
MRDGAIDALVTEIEAARAKLLVQLYGGGPSHERQH